MKSLLTKIQKEALTAYDKACLAANIKATKAYAEGDKARDHADDLYDILTNKADKIYDKEIEQANILYKRMLKGK
jgi:hypothetical protein